MRPPHRQARALLQLDRIVQDQGRGRHAIVERCQIGERLEGRADLAIGLGRPVELARVERPAAVERQHPAGMGIERHHRTRHVRDLAQRPMGEGRRCRGGDRLRHLDGLALLGRGRLRGRRRFGHDRLDQDHVAALHDLLGRLRRDADMLVVGRGPRPFHFLHGQDAGRAIDEADLGRVGLDLAHQRQLPGGGTARHRHGGQGLLPALGLGIDLQMRHRPAPAMAPVIGDQPVAQRLVGIALQDRIQAGADRQAGFIDLVLAEALDQLTPDLFGEIGRGEHLSLVALLQHDRLGFGRARLGLGDGADLGHAVDDIVAPAFGRVVMARRVVVGRPLDRAGQECRLRHAQLVDRLVEIDQRTGGDAIGAAAEIDLVQIELEDAFLRQRLLHTDGEDRFLDLAREAVLVAEQHVLRDLLGDGRGADLAPALADMHEILDGGAHHGRGIDAAMGEELAILGRQHGLDHARRNGRDRHEHAALGRVFRQQTTVAGMHAGHDRRLIAGQLLEIRQVRRVMLIDHESRAGAEHQQQEQREKQRLNVAHARQRAHITRAGAGPDGDRRILHPLPARWVWPEGAGLAKRIYVAAAPKVPPHRPPHWRHILLFAIGGDLRLRQRIGAAARLFKRRNADRLGKYALYRRTGARTPATQLPLSRAHSVPRYRNLSRNNIPHQ